MPYLNHRATSQLYRLLHACRLRCSVHGLVSPAQLMSAVWLDAVDGQRTDDTGQRCCRSWSVSLPPPVSCCGNDGQVGGVLRLRFIALFLRWACSEKNPADASKLMMRAEYTSNQMVPVIARLFSG